jgi:hypothetical protein
MAIRTNGLKNFKGQTYATTFDVAEAISALKQSGKDVFLAGLLGTGTSADSGKVAMYNADGVFQTTGYSLGVTTETDFGGENKLATESGVAAYVAKIKQNIEGSALGIAEGQNVYFTDGEGTTKKINAFGYKLVKRTSAETGYAATYDLQISDRNGNYTTVTESAPINIVKDQFLKSATMVWGASATLTPNGDVLGESVAKGEATPYPFLKMVMYTDVDTGDDSTTTVYIPVNELFRDYTYAKNATQVQIAISDDNVISATLVDGGVVTSKLADSAVTNAKIATGTIEKGKFVASVQTSLGLADTAIQAGDVARIAYTPVGGTATNVKAYLDTLTENLNNIDVTADITAEIAKLDVADTAVAGQYVSSVSEVDGKIVVSRANLPTYTLETGTENGTVAFNGTNVAVKGLDSAAYAKTTDFDAAGSASAVLGKSDDTADKATVYGAKAQAAAAQATADSVKNTIVNKVVQLVETNVTMTQANAETPSVGKIGGRVLAVFDAEGVQVYPEITYANGESTMTADFGEAKSETFTVIHTVAITI